MRYMTLAPANNVGLNRNHAKILAGVLLAVLAFFLIGSAQQESQTFDESTHLAAGYAYWHHGDFGKNPEHPPLVKLLASLPLLPLHLREPGPSHIPYFKAQDNTYGTELLYSGGANADAALFRGRLVVMLLSLVLGGLIFSAAQECFDSLVAVFALFLYVFQPLLLGNGNIVTTDIALACFLFASTYTFYRFCKKASPARFIVCAVTVCLAVTSKHSGILVLPILCLLALAEAFLLRPTEPDLQQQPNHRRWLLEAMAGLVIISYAAIWASYGFAYHPLHIPPPMAAYAAGLTHPVQRNLLLWLASHKLFPEPYLYGWVDILLIPSTRPSFLLGHISSAPQAMFFPVAFAIKSTLALLVFLLLLPLVRVSGRRREWFSIVIPGLFFFAVCLVSRMNGGARYLIPMYPYCILLAAVAAAAMYQRSRLSQAAVAVVLLIGFMSTLHSYPNFLAYSNEIAGGPARTYRSLTDPDADWGQGLKWTQAYMAKHPDPNCWFDFFGNPGINLATWNIPCKQLLSGFQHTIGIGTQPIPATISGTVLVSSTDIDGLYWGPADLNPYQVFRNRKPDANIANIILVYRGTFFVPQLAAETNAVAANTLLHQHRISEALALAKIAAQQAPDSADVQATLGQVMLASGHVPEGQQAIRKSLALAESIEPDFQKSLIRQIQQPGPHP